MSGNYIQYTPLQSAETQCLQTIDYFHQDARPIGNIVCRTSIILYSA